MEDELVEVYEEKVYVWICPGCDETHEEGEDPYEFATTVECDKCGKIFEFEVV